MGPISYESDLNPLETTIALIPWGSGALTSLTLNPGNSPVSTPRFYLGFANAESRARLLRSSLSEPDHLDLAELNP